MSIEHSSCELQKMGNAFVKTILHKNIQRDFQKELVGNAIILVSLFGSKQSIACQLLIR